jgi:hypothetical protein
LAKSPKQKSQSQSEYCNVAQEDEELNPNPNSSVVFGRTKPMARTDRRDKAERQRRDAAALDRGCELLGR